MNSNEEYRELRDFGRQAQEAGRWEEALELFQQAFDWAERNGDKDLVDRATCNLSLPKIEIGQGTGCLTQLRRILTASSDPENRYLASYNLSYNYERAREIDKGLFYARIALKCAEHMERDDWRAASYNSIGNLFLLDSNAREARSAFDAALELLPGDPGVFLGTVLGNIGYCHLLNGELRQAFTYLYKSWRMLRTRGEKKVLMSYRLDLAYAHLEADRPRDAARHAQAALEMAHDIQNVKAIKNALYILGESASLTGDLERARWYYEELQEFYPGLPHVTDFLLAVDVRKLINLRA